MSQPEYITHLYPPKTTVVKPSPPTLDIGRRYLLQDLQVLPDHASHGLIGDYRFDSHRAQLVPACSADGEAAVYFWDSNCDLTALSAGIKRNGEPEALSKFRLQNNRLELNQLTLHGPEVETLAHGACLSLSPRFQLTYSTDAFAARLGLLHLVQAQRYVELQNGERIMLLDTGDEDEPVLYLANPNDSQALSWTSSDQNVGESQTYDINTTISQTIPSEVADVAVVSLTVLERYSSYLMQTALGTEDQRPIWTPLFPPISWGWSMRIAPREDGVWDIYRRKLMLPITGHDGVQFPLWNSNSQAFSNNADVA